MEQILKDILKENSDKNAWLLQVLVDNLATNESIPLRLIRYQQLKNLYYLLEEQARLNDSKNENHQEDQLGIFHDNFKTEVQFKEFCHDLVVQMNSFNQEQEADNIEDPIQVSVEKLKKLEFLTTLYNVCAAKIFPILPASMHSLEFLNQTILPSWRIFSILWMYDYFNRNIKQNNTKPILVKDFYGIPSYHLIYQEIESCDEDSLFLLAGPTFILPSASILNEEENKLLIDYAWNKISQYVKHYDNSVNIHSSYIRQVINQEVTYHQDYLEKGVHNIVTAWHLLLKTTVKGEPTRKWLRILVVWAFICLQRNKDGNVSKEQIVLKNDLFANEAEDNTRFIIYSVKSCTRIEPCKPNLSLCIEINTALTSINSSNNYKQYMISKLLKIVNNPKKYSIFYDKQNSVQFTKEPGISFLNYCRKLERKSKQLTKNRLFILELWLNGVFAGIAQTTSASSDNKNNKKLAAWICALLRADIAEIFTYHPEEEKVLGLGKIYTNKHNMLDENKLFKCLQNLSLKNQKYSNIYKVLETGEPQACFKPEEIKLTYKNLGIDAGLEEKAEIVVPIKFNRRILGVIEVATFTPYRFQLLHRSILFNMATKLSIFWYQDRYQSALDKIQKSILDFYKNPSKEEDLWNKICEQAAKIFLVKGAGLWLIETDNNVLRKGYHKIEINSPNLDTNKPCLIGDMLNKIKEVGATNMHQYSHSLESPTIPINSENKKKLKEQGIKYLWHIPIFTQDNEIRAILSIYDQSSIGFDDSWEYICHFFSNHIGVIIESIQAYIRDKQSIYTLSQHELVDTGSHIHEKVAQLSRPIIPILNQLDQLNDTLNTPELLEYVFIQQKLGKVSSNFTLKTLLEDIKMLSHQLQTRSTLPLDDIKYCTKKLRWQIDALDPKLRSAYEKKHQQELRNIKIKGIPIFSEFMINNQLLGLISKILFLRAIISKNLTTSKGDARYNSVSSNIRLNTKEEVLSHIIRNLWQNALKHKINSRGTIVFTTETTASKGLLLHIENQSKFYTPEQLKSLTKEGVQENKGKAQIDNTYDKGLGLYLIDNLCKHVLNEWFSIKQVKRGDNYYFIASIEFSANSVKGYKYE